MKIKVKKKTKVSKYSIGYWAYMFKFSDSLDDCEHKVKQMLTEIGVEVEE